MGHGYSMNVVHITVATTLFGCKVVVNISDAIKTIGTLIGIPTVAVGGTTIPEVAVAVAVVIGGEAIADPVVVTTGTCEVILGTTVTTEPI